MLNRKLRFLLPFASAAGCYTYQPIAAATVPVGTEVRARITGAASDRVAPLIGSLDTRVLDGNVVDNSNGTMTLEVPTGSMPNVTQNVIHLRTRVPIAPTDLVTLEQRKLDVRRTVLLSGGIAAVVAAGIGVAIHSGADPQPGNVPNQPPPINRIPIVRLHF